MKTWMSILLLMMLFCIPSANAVLPITIDFSHIPQQQASQAWPVVKPLSPPDGLRPCCAFGYKLKTNLLGMPVPFYRIDNVVNAGNTGQHSYNNSHWNAVLALTGLNRENNGIIYTRRGGFIDTAHIRDSADMTFWIFSQLYPKLGTAFSMSPGEDELARREIVFGAFQPPDDPATAYTLAVWMAATVAYDIAAWHEIAQWYGFESVPGFSEGISAFSPEDLYSNMVGVRLAATLLLTGHGYSQRGFNIAMTTLLPEALRQLGAESPDGTRFHFDMLDGIWWDSHRSVPEKFLVLKRNYLTGNDRVPTPVPGQPEADLALTLPVTFAGQSIAALGELRLFNGQSMQQLPAAQVYYHWPDFPALASAAQRSDQQQLQQLAPATR